MTNGRSMFPNRYPDPDERAIGDMDPDDPARLARIARVFPSLEPYVDDLVAGQGFTVRRLVERVQWASDGVRAAAEFVLHLSGRARRGVTFGEALDGMRAPDGPARLVTFAEALDAMNGPDQVAAFAAMADRWPLAHGKANEALVRAGAAHAFGKLRSFLEPKAPAEPGPVVFPNGWDMAADAPPSDTAPASVPTPGTLDGNRPPR